MYNFFLTSIHKVIMSLRRIQFYSLLFRSVFHSQLKTNQTCLVTKRLAGHSKWSNIKHIKMSKDNMKSLNFQKLSQKIGSAVREGGGNPDLNHKLRLCIEEARKISMPNTTIQNAIKNALNSSASKPYWLAYTRLDGLVLCFEVVSNNPMTAIAKINQYTKRLGLKHSKQINDLYVERGIILCDPHEKGYDKAVEDGINIGADEVEEDDDKSLIFECSPLQLDRINKDLTELGYKITSATTELQFFNNVKILPEEEKVKELIVNKLSDFDDLIRVDDNITKN